MEQRIEFVLMVSQPDANISRLCKQFSISRRTGYKWLKRYYHEGYNGLHDRSKRPRHSPKQTNPEIEQYVVALRKKDPEWGAKKLHKIICNHKQEGLYPFKTIPCKATITKILDRHNLIDRTGKRATKEYQRFEYAYPNELWQMDYKGQFKLLNKKLCFPLTITDDHSRFNVCLSACTNQKEQTVKQELTGVFRKYGMPNSILTDNANPWGSAGSITSYGTIAFTRLEKWFIQLNIGIIHGRPYHPQTQGKEERFHRTLKQELLNHQVFQDHKHCQNSFDKWRLKYNCERPHEAIDFEVPAKRYQPSQRAYPEKIKPYEYDLSAIKRKVHDEGFISFRGKPYRVGKAFIGDYIALTQTGKDGQYDVYFCDKKIRTLTL